MAATLPGIDLTGLLIIPTSQHSVRDLVRVGEEIETEKDELLEKFVLFANTVCRQLIRHGYWADYLDPCSGLTMINKSNGSVYSEVDAFSTLLQYKTANAGCCKVLLHPEWGSYVYPASFFAKAPLEVLKAAIQAADEAVMKSTC